MSERSAVAAPPPVAPSEPLTPDAHFRRYFYAAVLLVLRRLVERFGSWSEVFEAFPFLREYNNELARGGLAGVSTKDAMIAWWRALEAEELAGHPHLPLRVLREAACLVHEDLLLLMTANLAEEDARFGLVVERCMEAPGQLRPTRALLESWMGDERSAFTSRVARLERLGLLVSSPDDVLRGALQFHTPAPLWAALRDPGEAGGAPGAVVGLARAPALESLVLSRATRQEVERTLVLAGAGSVDLLVVRGPRGNGRRTLLAAMARELGRGTLRVPEGGVADPIRTGVWAAILNAMPVFTAEPAPGETFALPARGVEGAPAGVALGPWGGISGEEMARAAVIQLVVPDEPTRERVWREALPQCAPSVHRQLARTHRLPAGRIHRLAPLARTNAALHGRAQVDLRDFREAARLLGRQALETLATRVEGAGGWDDLVLDADTSAELRALEARCRQREALLEAWGDRGAGRPGLGVRAIFSGPSGTGKTMAARCLAGALGKDLYRADLAAIVDKYIGETERRLHSLLSAAEQLDMPLLIDEADSLLAPRTGVHSSTDRYANLETNFLLQRLESFEGVVVFATNAGAGDRVDRAYERRMDAVVAFRVPEVRERWAIWQLHLPPGHAVDPGLLHEVSYRCAMTGAQIQQAVLHAMLLALEGSGQVEGPDLEAAVRREYRKVGASCPLRRSATVEA